MKKILTCAIALVCVLSAGAKNSFGIFVDSKSYEACRPQLEKYCESVCSDGLDAFIIEREWTSPEEVRDLIRQLYDTRNLEGVVFVGNIPVAMIQGAQHMTTAFKMNEQEFDRFDTSVPSDRFYDDFDLKFDFEGRDSVRTNFFYYRLSPDSKQTICSDIYSARIKPSSLYGDSNVELAAYLEKLVRVREDKKNSFDKFFSYTGDGSFSNSLIAWKDETKTVSEQFPETADSSDGAKFFAWAMFDFPKDNILKEIQRDDLDFAIFHEHGVPDRQYLSGIPSPRTLEMLPVIAQYNLRQAVRLCRKRGRDISFAKTRIEEAGLDDTWYQAVIDESDSLRIADSLLNAHTGIMLKDIQEVKPNVKVAVFDACYNGDFREPDCVAARYIFAGGNCVVTVGNSVNVLQDKSSTDLMGMLACGYSVGEWMKETNILESHIHGDPTFHFASSYKFQRPDPMNTDIRYWKKYLDKKYPCDIRGLAIHKLFNLDCPGLSQILLDTYKNSPEYMLRLQCMQLLAFYNDGSYPEVLKLASDDPYEFIRRKASDFMGQVGSPEMAECMAATYLREYNSLRIAFDIAVSSGDFYEGEFWDAFCKDVEDASWIYDKEAFKKELQFRYDSAQHMDEYYTEAIDGKDRKPKYRYDVIGGLRNCPFIRMAPKLISMVNDSTEDVVMRVRAAEVLGWYVRAYNKTDLIDALQNSLDGELPETVSAEVTKTINRLKEYTR